jgi:hypothetical protein
MSDRQANIFCDSSQVEWAIVESGKNELEQIWVSIIQKLKEVIYQVGE